MEAHEERRACNAEPWRRRDGVRHGCVMDPQHCGEPFKQEKTQRVSGGGEQAGVTEQPTTIALAILYHYNEQPTAASHEHHGPIDVKISQRPPIVS